MYKLPNIKQRPSGKVPTTAVTNELAAAVNGLSPVLRVGQEDEHPYGGGGTGTLPVPQFVGQSLTGLDGVAVWMMRMYLPKLP